MLDVINAQGAQVKALEGQVAQLQTLLVLYAHRAGGQRFTRADQDAAAETGIDYRQNRDGTIVVTIRK